MPLLSTRPAVTFRGAEHHRRLTSTKLYCLVIKAHGCNKVAKSRYASMTRPGIEPATITLRCKSDALSVRVASPRHIP